MIWFDEKISYGSPSYYVQKMYGNNIGDVTLVTGEEVKKAWEEKIYYALSYKEAPQEIILKIVNANEEEKTLAWDFSEWKNVSQEGKVELLTGPDLHGSNSIQEPQQIMTREYSVDAKKEVVVPGNSFAVFRFWATE